MDATVAEGRREAAVTAAQFQLVWHHGLPDAMLHWTPLSTSSQQV